MPNNKTMETLKETEEGVDIAETKRTVYQETSGDELAPSLHQQQDDSLITPPSIVALRSQLTNILEAIAELPFECLLDAKNQAMPALKKLVDYMEERKENPNFKSFTDSQNETSTLVAFYHSLLPLAKLIENEVRQFFKELCAIYEDEIKEGINGDQLNALCEFLWKGLFNTSDKITAIPGENSENPSKTNQASKKVYGNGENKPKINQSVESLAGSADKLRKAVSKLETISDILSPGLQLSDKKAGDSEASGENDYCMLTFRMHSERTAKLACHPQPVDTEEKKDMDRLYPPLVSTQKNITVRKIALPTAKRLLDTNLVQAIEVQECAFVLKPASFLLRRAITAKTIEEALYRIVLLGEWITKHPQKDKFNDEIIKNALQSLCYSVCGSSIIGPQYDHLLRVKKQLEKEPLQTKNATAEERYNMIKTGIEYFLALYGTKIIRLPLF